MASARSPADRRHAGATARGLRPLQRLGLDAQTLKVALAAALAWSLGRVLPGNPRPYFAPLAAILVAQVTVAATVTRSVQRVLGVVAGVAVALVLVRFAGLSGWSIGAMVLAALLVGRSLHLGPQGTPQAAVSALLVTILGAHTAWAYAWARVVESALGAAVGVLVTALVIPPNYLPEAEAALQALVVELAEVLRALAGAWASGAQPGRLRRGLRQARRVGARLQAARGAVGRAEESLRLNVFGRGQARRLLRLRLRLAAAERMAMQVRGLARTLAELAPQRRADGAEGVTAALQAAAAAVEAVGRGPAVLRRPHGAGAVRGRGGRWLPRRLRRRRSDAWAAAWSAWRRLAAHAPASGPEAGALLVDLRRLLQELADLRRAAPAARTRRSPARLRHRDATQRRGR